MCMSVFLVLVDGFICISALIIIYIISRPMVISIHFSGFEECVFLALFIGVTISCLLGVLLLLLDSSKTCKFTGCNLFAVIE